MPRVRQHVSYSKPGNMRTHFRTKHQGQIHGPCVCCTPGVSFTSNQRLKLHMEARKKVMLAELLEMQD